MSGRIRFLRGTSSQIQETSKKLDIGQPLYNTDKNYLTVSGANLTDMDSQPITARYIKGWYADAKSITKTLDNNYYYFGPNETTDATNSSTIIRGVNTIDFYINGNGTTNKYITLERVSSGDSINLLKNANTKSITADGNIETTGTLSVTGNTTIAGQLVVSYTGNAGSTSSSTPGILIGNKSGGHLQLDYNEVQANSDSNTFSTLYLNRSGGNIYFSKYTDGGMYLVQSSDLSPVTSGGLNLGTNSKKWNNLFLSGDVSANDGTYSGSVSATSYIGTGVLNTTVTGALAGHTAASWTNNTKIPTLNTIASWDGRYSSNSETSSRLAYCNKGAFGTIVTKNTGDYVNVTSAQTITGNKTFNGAMTVNNTLTVNTLNIVTT